MAKYTVKGNTGDDVNQEWCLYKDDKKISSHKNRAEAHQARKDLMAKDRKTVSETRLDDLNTNKNDVSVKESVNESVLDDVDDDGFMAKRQLYDIAKYAIKLHKMIQDGDNLEPWVQAKITKAADYIDTVKHHLEYQGVRSAEDEEMNLDLDIAPVDEVMPTRAFESEARKRFSKMMKPLTSKKTVNEGWYTLPPYDKNRYQERDGLEGPYQTRAGKVVYYDPIEGSYYDPDTDMYMSSDEYNALNEEHESRHEGYVEVQKREYQQVAGMSDVNGNANGMMGTLRRDADVIGFHEPSESMPPEDDMSYTDYYLKTEVAKEFGFKDASIPYRPDPDKLPSFMRREAIEEGNPCWDGYEKVPGKKDYETGSCRKKKVNEIGPEGKVHRAASADQSDREYIEQLRLKNRWKEKNPGKKWPGYTKARQDLAENYLPGLPDAKKAKPTRRHRPAIWEAMLGTVYAMNDAGEVKSFDRDYNAAIEFSGAADNNRDPRLHRLKNNYRHSGDSDDYIQKGKLVYWILKQPLSEKEGGMSDKERRAYNRKHGSNLKRAQPSGGKRRTSYCARSKGQMDMHNIDCRKDSDKPICKARRDWNC